MKPVMHFSTLLVLAEAMENQSYHDLCWIAPSVGLVTYCLSAARICEIKWQNFVLGLIDCMHKACFASVKPKRDREDQSRCWYLGRLAVRAQYTWPLSVLPLQSSLQTSPR